MFGLLILLFFSIPFLSIFFSFGRHRRNMWFGLFGPPRPPRHFFWGPPPPPPHFHHHMGGHHHGPHHHHW